VCRGVDCNFAVTVWYHIKHYIHTQWLDEDNDAIALSSDSEVFADSEVFSSDAAWTSGTICNLGKIVLVIQEFFVGKKSQQHHHKDHAHPRHPPTRTHVPTLQVTSGPLHEEVNRSGGGADGMFGSHVAATNADASDDNRNDIAPVYQDSWKQIFISGRYQPNAIRCISLMMAICMSLHAFRDVCAYRMHAYRSTCKWKKIA